MSKFDDLVTKLSEIFQIDRPELDFGIYRILNARANEINDYLENRLAEKVQAALNSGSNPAKKIELEDRHVLSVDESRESYLNKLFSRVR